MKSGILYIFITFFAILFHSVAFAQDILVTAKGDTIKGEIKPLTYGVDKKVQVVEPGKKKVIYTIFQIKSFSFKGETFQPVKGPNGYTFMKLIKSGYLSLFAFQPENQVTYDGAYLLKRDGTGIEVPNLTFKKGMRKFLDDCPAVENRIENDELNKKDLYQIIDQYNACVDGRSATQQKVVNAKIEQTKKISAWDVLEEKVKTEPDFEGKSNALEMIGEIKSKISTSQKIPNFLLEGLKSSLNQDVFKTELENALKEVN
jgi:hypothetical protein